MLDYTLMHPTMRKNKLLQFMVTTEQHDRIKNLTNAKGFIHVSDYLRYSVLEKDLTFERKFEEIYKGIITLLKIVNIH